VKNKNYEKAAKLIQGATRVVAFTGAKCCFLQGKATAVLEKFMEIIETP